MGLYQNLSRPKGLHDDEGLGNAAPKFFFIVGALHLTVLALMLKL